MNMYVSPRDGLIGNDDFGVVIYYMLIADALREREICKLKLREAPSSNAFDVVYIS